MSGFAIGIAILLMMSAGFVWGRVGLQWNATGYWNSITVNDFYGLIFRRELSGEGAIGQAIGLVAGIDLGIVFLVAGLGVYYIAVRNVRG